MCPVKEFLVKIQVFFFLFNVFILHPSKIGILAEMSLTESLLNSIILGPCNLVVQEINSPTVYNRERVKKGPDCWPLVLLGWTFVLLADDQVNDS